MTEQYAEKISAALALPLGKVSATIELLNADNTLPFIARYRKEATGGLDEEEIRAIEGLVESLRALDERRATVLASIEEQGKLTPELRAEIAAAGHVQRARQRPSSSFSRPSPSPTRIPSRSSGRMSCSSQRATTARW